MKKQFLIFFAITLLSTSVFTSKADASEKYSMSYLDFYNNYAQLVDATNQSLNAVTPNYFYLNTDGSFKVSGLDSNFINQMHNKGIKVVPFLSNNWDQTTGRNALASRDQLSAKIANAVSQYNLDGVNIDLEGLNETDQATFTDFIKLLRSKLPKNKEVSIAVAANPNGWKTGWHGMYDYQSLSQYADYLMIMAYDESWEGSDPGPVASLPFVEKSITYATVTQQVSPSKIVLGMPFYGRIWNLNDPSTSVNGDAVSLSKVPNLLSTYHATAQYSKADGSAYATFTIHAGDPLFKINSWSDPLPPGSYKIWFENEQSFKAKLGLVQKYNLKGVGSWSLGQENTNLWNYYSLWLNGKYFSDVPQNYWAKEAILSVEQKGWMLGTSSSTFSPEKTLTRAQGAATLVRALELQAKVPVTQSFTDVKPSYWAYSDIEVAKQYGLFNGVSANSFQPTKALTREQMAAVLYRIIGSNGQVAAPTSPFIDVPTTSWAYESISIMQQRGIFGGYSDGSFKPGKELSRVEMAALMYRIANYINP